MNNSKRGAAVVLQVFILVVVIGGWEIAARNRWIDPSSRGMSCYPRR